MVRERVNSTAIRNIGYDPKRLILEVEFHNGTIYQYMNVPGNVHNTIMHHESQGRYLNMEVAKRYKYKRIL